MSFQVFISDLQEEDLTSKRLQEVWEFCNLKNKSPLIDRLVRCLSAEITRRAGNGAPEDVVIPRVDVQLMCKKFSYNIVRSSITPQKPYLESLPPNLSGSHPGGAWNPSTAILFRPKNKDIIIKKENSATDWIATHCLKNNRVYPLRLCHFNICTTNGWYFETDNTSISSPFRVTSIST